MSFERRIRASRANGALSRGPVTPEGRAHAPPSIPSGQGLSEASGGHQRRGWPVLRRRPAAGRDRSIWAGNAPLRGWASSALNGRDHKLQWLPERNRCPIRQFLTMDWAVH